MIDTARTPARGYDALIGLGSNLGDKAGNIARALELLCADAEVALVRRSRNWKSAPWGIAEQDWFVNACAAVRTSLSPEQLLARCLAVEDRMGRVRVEKWGPRLIDVDVLTYRDIVTDTPLLKIPHPFIEKRSFVVVPMAEIAPEETVRGARIADLAKMIDGGDIVPM